MEFSRLDHPSDLLPKLKVGKRGRRIKRTNWDAQYRKLKRSKSQRPPLGCAHKKRKPASSRRNMNSSYKKYLAHRDFSLILPLLFSISLPSEWFSPESFYRRRGNKVSSFLQYSGCSSGVKGYRTEGKSGGPPN